MQNTIYASFSDPSDAEKAAGALLDHGIKAEDLSVVSNQGTYVAETHTYRQLNADPADVMITADGAVPLVTSTNYVEDDGDYTEDAAKHGLSTTTAADAGAGAVKGVGWGLGVGAVAALAALFLPGIGFVLGGGALAIALGGLAATTGAGAAAGAITGYLKDQGVEHYIAETYTASVSGGGALLAINVPSGNCGADEALEVLTKYGATNMNTYDARVKVA